MQEQSFVIVLSFTSFPEERCQVLMCQLVEIFSCLELVWQTMVKPPRLGKCEQNFTPHHWRQEELCLGNYAQAHQQANFWPSPK